MLLIREREEHGVPVTCLAVLKRVLTEEACDLLTPPVGAGIKECEPGRILWC